MFHLGDGKIKLSTLGPDEYYRFIEVFICFLIGFLFRFCVSVNLNAIFQKPGNSASISVILKSCQAMKQFPRCRCHSLTKR